MIDRTYMSKSSKTDDTMPPAEASAPDLISVLATQSAELTRLTAEVERLKEQCESPFMDGYETAKHEYREQLIKAEEDNERLRTVLKNINWQSADKDNMEFEARITCFQMDNIRAALKEKTAADYGISLENPAIALTQEDRT